MLLNEFDLAYVAKRIKDETGVDMCLKKVHIDNAIPVTEENRKMFLDIVVDSFISTKDAVPVENIDGDMKTFTLEEILGDE